MRLLFWFLMLPVLASSFNMCNSIANSIKFILSNQHLQDGLILTTEFVCNKFHIYAPSVCHGLLERIKKPLFEIVVEGIVTSQKLCHYPIKIMKDWRLSIPKKNTIIHPIRRILPKESSIGILHLSDLHFDVRYTTGSESACGMPVCCRKSDDSLQILKPAGKYGEYKCDSSISLLMSSFDYVKSLKDKPKIMYLTGDFATHFIWNNSLQTQKESIQNMSKMMTENFPAIRIFPCVGNHESFPTNNFPNKWTMRYSNCSWMYDTMATSWAHWLNEGALKTIRIGGYYTIMIEPGWRLISLNTNFCDSHNLWMFIDSYDPMGQLAWLINTLLMAEKNKEVVHIIGHHPPFYEECLEVWASQLRKILIRFSDVIAAAFFGHTHMDEFQVLMDDVTAEPTMISYIAPSIVPFQNLNPALRIYRVHDKKVQGRKYPTRIVLDHETHILNISAANTANKAQWYLEYVASKEYRLQDLHPKSWLQFVYKMMKDDELYHHFNQKRVRRKIDSSKIDIRPVSFCYLLTSSEKNNNYCKKIKSGIF